MKHPKSSNVRFVAQQFVDAINRYPNLVLNMEDGGVNDNHLCGTSHCHGGTYALMRCDLDKTLTYADGATSMAKDLGFEDVDEFGNWLKENPDNVWGNEYGPYLFGSMPISFLSESRPFGAMSICDIAKHWIEVADRLEILEQHA